MDVIQVTRENYVAFKNLMSIHMRTLFNCRRDVFALGAVEDGIAVGVIGVWLREDGAADIEYLFVIPNQRHKLFATQLLYTAAVISQQQEDIQGLRFKYCDNSNLEDGIIPFFQFCDFMITEIKDDITYQCKLKDFDKMSLPKDIDVTSIKKYSSLSEKEKNILLQESPDFLSTAKNFNYIEEDISLITIQNNEISNCVVLIEDKNNLILAWSKSSGNGIIFMAMLYMAIEKAKEKYSEDKSIIIPTINEISGKICKKMLGEKTIVLEKNFEGTLLFDDDRFESLN